ncbi:MAG TPA: UTP--glucose-1-phosphate uridylyltransferase [Candidatus Bathyarchaeia archaeon]|nr:UTP--glucose-1-phosphate uridylyltransferase [Candidatus Bathyarchaeia archaeon]
MAKIKKAIITAAGYGTRFLPATKVQPKEMLPIIDKPIIQYLVEEAVASGITDVIIVTRAGLNAVEDHFDSSFEIERQLETNNKKSLLRQVRQIPKLANFIYLRQTKDLPYGNGAPLLVAANLIEKGESFVYMFGDDLVKSKVPAVKQLISVWQKDPTAVVVAAQPVPRNEVNRYGIIKFKKGSQDQIEDIVEKPDPAKAPSNLAQFGRFILNKKVISLLAEKKLGMGGELWLTDAISRYAKKRKTVVAKVEGKWYTTGDPLRYMKAMVEFALDRPDFGREFKKYLQSLNLS